MHLHSILFRHTLTHVYKHILVLFFNGINFLLAQNKFANFLPAFVYRRKGATAQKTKNLFPPFKLGSHLKSSRTKTF